MRCEFDFFLFFFLPLSVRFGIGATIRTRQEIHCLFMRDFSLIRSSEMDFELSWNKFLRALVIGILLVKNFISVLRHLVCKMSVWHLEQ